MINSEVKMFHKTHDSEFMLKDNSPAATPEIPTQMP